MRKEILFAAIAPYIGVNKNTNRLMYCNDAGDDYNDVNCNDCTFCSSCGVVSEEKLNLMKIMWLKEHFNNWNDKTEILDYAKVHVGVDSEDDTKLFDCYEGGRAVCANCKFNETKPWCSHNEKIKFFLQFE